MSLLISFTFRVDKSFRGVLYLLQRRRAEYEEEKPPMAVKAADAEVSIVRVDQGHVRINLLGTSPLICNRMSEKARRELLLPRGRLTQAERSGNLKHDPIAEFRASPYILRADQPTLIGLMSSSFKGAMRTAALDLPGATAAKIGRLVYVEGDYVPIYGIPELFMSITRSADMNKTPDVRTRAIIPHWACRIDISFVQPIIRTPAVTDLMAAAGITAGVGDWRPEKGKGAYGRFRIVEDTDPEFLAIIKGGGREIQKIAMETPDPYDEETKELLGWYEIAAKQKGFEPTSAGSNGFVDEDELEEVIS